MILEAIAICFCVWLVYCLGVSRGAALARSDLKSVKEKMLRDNESDREILAGSVRGKS